MNHDGKQLPAPEQEKRVKEHQTNLIAYTVTALFGVLLAAVLIPNFVRLKKNADFGPEKFPYILACVFVLLGVSGLILEVLAIRREGLPIGFPGIQLKQYLPQAVMILSGFAFIFAAGRLGFLAAAAVFTAFWLFLYGGRRWKFNIVWAVVYSILIYLLFSRVLGIRFTGGILSF